MKNMNKKSINYGLKALALFAFGLILFPVNNVHAEGGVNYIYNTPVGINNNPPVYTSTPNPVTYIPTNTPVVYSNTTAKKSAKTVAKTSTTNTVASTSTNTNDQNDSYKNLAANAVLGTNSFLPSGLVQWVLFAIFIILLIILSRRVFGGKEDYDNAPMKHA